MVLEVRIMDQSIGYCIAANKNLSCKL